MSGNVWEWCHDYFHDNYIGAPEDEDAWLTPTASYRVLRGGSWNNVASGYRSVSRGHHVTPDSGYLIIGFRLALTP
jgi:formylglycine-generating enzyme required for sulfatase activity